jgi:cytochrome oxidase Cu insertion factor (SCO1/SenC/PrrC family)
MFCRFLILVLSLLPVALLLLDGTAQARQRKSPSAQKKAAYICVMDPEVKSTRPGKCPRCGMLLRQASEVPTANPAGTSTGGPDRNGDLAGPLHIPDASVFDQDGRKLRFYSDLVKGKTVAINFIFTTCTTICPPLTATFAKVQQQLGETAGGEVHFISISVDPTTDVPERLKAFSAKFHSRPGWTFVTGSRQEISLLLKALGASVGDKNDHSATVLVGNDRAAYWTRTYGLAPVSALLKVITDASAKTASETSSQVPLPAPNAGAVTDERQVAGSLPVAGEARGAARPDGKPMNAKTPGELAAHYFPNTVLLTQDNKAVRFFDDLLKGKTVVINFIFTSCTGVCPPMTANLLKVQEQLGERVGKDIHMITLSVDPAIDTPEKLKEYTEKYRVKSGWYFLSGRKDDVEIVLRKIGGFVTDKNDHSTLIIAGNVETGQWIKLFATLKPAQIANEVLKLADSK